MRIRINAALAVIDAANGRVKKSTIFNEARLAGL